MAGLQEACLTEFRPARPSRTIALMTCEVTAKICESTAGAVTNLYFSDHLLHRKRLTLNQALAAGIGRRIADHLFSPPGEPPRARVPDGRSHGSFKDSD